MPKYSVREVLDIIKSLTADERQALKQQLPDVMDAAANPVAHDQSQTISGISIRGSSGVEMSQIHAEEASGIIPSKTQATIQNTSLPAALELLKQLKLDVAESKALNPVEKKTVEVPIEALETELKKPKPDRSLIAQAVEALKKGLAGIETLAGPVMKVANLIANAWVIGI